MSENCCKALYALHLMIFLSLPHYHAASAIITLNKHLYWCFSDVQNKLLQTLWRFFKNHRFSWFCGNYKILLPFALLAHWDNNEFHDSLFTSLIFGSGCQVGAQLGCQPETFVFLDRWLPGLCRAKRRHKAVKTFNSGWDPIRNVPDCRFLKAQTQTCSKSPLLYYIGPRVSNIDSASWGEWTCLISIKHMGREIVLWSSFQIQSTPFRQDKPYLLIRLLQQNFDTFMSSIYESMNFRVILSSSTKKYFKWDFEWSFRYHWFNKCLLSAYYVLAF